MVTRGKGGSGKARKKHPLFAIGKNEETINLAKYFTIEAILDDRALGREKWSGMKVIRPSELPDEAVVINCSSSIAPTSAAKRILCLRPKAKIQNYFSLREEHPRKLPNPRFVEDMKKDFKKNLAEWRWLKNIIKELKSKKTLADVCKFRLTGNPDILSHYKVQLREQYFDPGLPLSNGEAFVDCGGFDGDTTEEFIRRCPGYERVWLFEPSKKNLGKAKKRLKGSRDIQFISKGVSDRDGVLSFNSDKGSASALSNTGSTSIAVTTIDKEIQEPVSFIKMDLEGWEMKGLSGARKHIISDHPKLAIAVYHRAEDFWKIPRFILGLRSDYQVLLRHYTEGWSETVMYFIPIKQ
jgi:FkbM family methyltransferase